MTDWDKVLAFGSSFNWVTPLVDLAKDVSNDYEVFTCSRSRSVNSVKRRLKTVGINIWGVEYQDDTFTFRAKAEHAAHVRMLL